jgi:hypothetical protein
MENTSGYLAVATFEMRDCISAMRMGRSNSSTVMAMKNVLGKTKDGNYNKPRESSNKEREPKNIQPCSYGPCYVNICHLLFCASRAILTRARSAKCSRQTGLRPGRTKRPTKRTLISLFRR